MTMGGTSPRGGAGSRGTWADGWLDPFRSALDALDRPKQVFFRLDDAGAPGAWPDDVLCDLSRHGLVCDVGVAPARLSVPLVDSLTGWALVDGMRLHHHGSAGTDDPPGPAGVPAGGGLLHGRHLLWRELGSLVDDVFTPDARSGSVTPELGTALVDLGVTTLSTDLAAAPLGVEGLAEVPVTVRWSSHDTDRPHGRDGFARRLVQAVGRPEPLGVLLGRVDGEVGDAAGRTALDQLLRLCSTHPYLAPTTIAELGAGQRSTDGDRVRAVRAAASAP